MTSKFQDKTIVGLYMRVSTDQQDHELQRSQLLAECKRLDYEVYDEYADFITGASETRENLDRLIRDAKKGCFNKILIWKLDRLSRDVRIGLNILYQIESIPSIEISFIQEPFINTNRQNPAMAEMARNMILIGAQMELKSIRERTRASKTALIQANRWPSCWVPIGLRKTQDQQLEIDPAAAPIVKRIVAMYLDEKLSMREIKRQLEKEGIPAFRNSKKWNKDGISKMLSNPIYIGKKPINAKKLGITHTFICPAIISEERFNAVQARKQEMSDMSGRKPNYAYPLRPYLFCAGCGHHLHGIQCGGSKLGKTYSYGQFHRPSDPPKFKRRCPDGCGRISERVLADSLFDHCIKVFATKSPLEIKFLLSENQKDKVMDSELLTVYHAETEKLENRRSRVVDMFEGDSINKTEFNRRMMAITAQENTILNKIRVLDQQQLRTEEDEELNRMADDIIQRLKGKSERLIKLYNEVVSSSKFNARLYLPDLQTARLSFVEDFLYLIKSIHVDFKEHKLHVQTKKPELFDGKLIYGPEPTLHRGRPRKLEGGSNYLQSSLSVN